MKLELYLYNGRIVVHTDYRKLVGEPRHTDVFIDINGCATPVTEEEYREFEDFLRQNGYDYQFEYRRAVEARYKEIHEPSWLVRTINWLARILP